MTDVCSSVFLWKATIIGPVSLDPNSASGCPTVVFNGEVFPTGSVHPSVPLRK